MALIKVNNNDVFPAQTLSVYETENLANISNKTVLYAEKLKNYQVPASSRLVVVNALANLYNITQDAVWATIIPFYGALRQHYVQQNVLAPNVDLHCCSIFATLRIKYPNGNDLVTEINNNTVIGVISAPVNNNAVLPYKSYVALITQSQTLNPDAIVLFNNIGTVSWLRAYKGIYWANIGVINKDKTVVFTQHNGINGTIIKSVATDNHIEFTNRVYAQNPDNPNIVDFNLQDSLMVRTSVEIRVYN